MTRLPGLDPGDLERFAGRDVLVVGDAILDRYWHGTVSRISPEAPVPVVRWEDEELRAGGSANVVANVVALGARAGLVSVVGDDEDGARLAELVRERGADDAGLVRVPGRATTVKTRILARHQQALRLDREDDAPVSDDVAGELVRRSLARLETAEALVISDYAKGTLDGRVLGPLLRAARERGVPSVVDPRLRNLDSYAPATVLTPNEAEAERASAVETRAGDGASRAARALLGRLEVDAVLVTRGGRGMLLAERRGDELRIPALEREVFDVTGAGDTVVATLAVALAAGLALPVAARWANAAGALAVGRLGTAAVGRGDLEALATAG